MVFAISVYFQSPISIQAAINDSCFNDCIMCSHPQKPDKFTISGRDWCNFPKDYSQLDNTQDHESNSISINRQFITIYWSEYHCQDEDYYDISFPTDYLFMSDEEWQKIEIIEKKKREIEYKKQEKEKAFEEREKQRKADIKEYKRLKVKLNK